MSTVHAPYNFVPFSDTVFSIPDAEAISHDMPFADGISGTIAFEIHADAPLCVGGERTKPRKGADPQDAGEVGAVRMFRTPDGEHAYAIPGSSIRGLIRNVVEIATFSRFSFLDDVKHRVRDFNDGRYRDTFVTRLSKNSRGPFQPNAKAGWLYPEEPNWGLVPCEFARVEQKDLIAALHMSETDFGSKQVRGNTSVYSGNCASIKYKNFIKKNKNRAKPELIVGEFSPRPHKKVDLVYRRLLINSESDQNNSDASYNGYFVFTGQPSATKHMEFFFYNEAEAGFFVEDDVKARFMEIVDKRGSEDSQADWNYLLERFRRLGEPIPVFYLPSDPDDPCTAAHIGLSMMFPILAPKSTAQLGQKPPADGVVDYATAIFGAAAADTSGGLKTRVSFSLAEVVPKAGSDVVTSVSEAGILGAPKSSFYPAYLQQSPRNETKEENGTNSNPPLKSYLSSDARLAGWKRYPARQDYVGRPSSWIPDDLRDKTALQTTLETVPRGTVFRGRIRIHNLRPFELGALLWALEFGQPGGPHRHGLGTGKPWGFGKVRIVPLEAGAAPDASTVLVPNLPKGSVPSFADCRAAFVARMNEAAAKDLRPKVKSWADSEQIQALLALANPAKVTTGVSPAGPLKYLALKDHAEAKKNKVALPRYPRRT